MEKYTLTVQDIKDVADGTKLFVFNKPEGFQFEAGQYVALEAKELVDDDGKGKSRALSIASAPYENELHFVMRQGESSFKRTVWSLQVGDQMLATKPVGMFKLDQGDAPIVFLIGGVGITPARSILRQAAHDAMDRSFTLFYSNRFLRDAAFHDELKSIPVKNFTYVTALTQEEGECSGENEERGYISQEMVKKYVSDPVGAKYYIVGSPDFSNAMKEMALGLGVDAADIHMDSFTGLRKPAPAPVAVTA